MLSLPEELHLNLVKHFSKLCNVRQKLRQDVWCRRRTDQWQSCQTSCSSTKIPPSSLSMLFLHRRSLHLTSCCETVKLAVNIICTLRCTTSEPPCVETTVEENPWGWITKQIHNVHTHTHSPHSCVFSQPNIYHVFSTNNRLNHQYAQRDHLVAKTGLIITTQAYRRQSLNLLIDSLTLIILLYINHIHFNFRLIILHTC